MKYGRMKVRRHPSFIVETVVQKWKESMEFLIPIIDYAYHIIDYVIQIWNIFKLCCC